MLLEVVDLSKDVSFVIEVYGNYEECIRSKLSFRSRAKVWKEEVYFETPLESIEGPLVHRVKKGGVYFWPPGKAMCLFYGVSQIYTPGIEIGRVIDPPNRLAVVEEGDELEIRTHSVSPELKDVVVKLREIGFEVGTPLEQGVKIVVAKRILGGIEISLSIYIEDYGVFIESEALGKFRDDISSLRDFNKLKKLIESTTKFSRLDISEDGYVVITACSDEHEEIAHLVEDVSRALWLAKKHLIY